MIVDAKALEFDALNQALRGSAEDCEILHCSGQRFIAAGLERQKLQIRDGVPGNALGAYLNGATIEVFGNAQDAVGDTMNSGEIVVHGGIGDAAGYAMRGGKIFVRGNAGYRAGIHMKEYQEKVPVMVIGGRAGCFLGEYQAGGYIIVLGLDRGERDIVGDLPCTGMHGGKIFLRSDCAGIHFPKQVHTHPATAEELAEIRGFLEEFCQKFDYKLDDILQQPFTVVVPDSKNPYQQMYVGN